nr:keywimysin-related RiPP [Halomonas sp. UBA3074]
MTINKGRKAYERPTLVEIGSIEKKTETYGLWKWWFTHWAAKLDGNFNHDKSHGGGGYPGGDLGS